LPSCSSPLSTTVLHVFSREKENIFKKHQGYTSVSSSANLKVFLSPTPPCFSPYSAPLSGWHELRIQTEISRQKHGVIRGKDRQKKDILQPVLEVLLLNV